MHMLTPPILEQILQLPTCDLQALELLQAHQAGEAIDWTQATTAMHELRAYTHACAELTKTITRIPPAPIEDADLLLTTML